MFGALKPKIDVRDYVYAAGACELPDSFLYEDMPPVKSQGSISSCVAHATAAILEYFNIAENGKYQELSTNFIYALGSNKTSKGMYLRDACKIAKQHGDPFEDTIPGNTEKPKCVEEVEALLTNEVYAEAANFKISAYAQCRTNEDIKKALINNGPVLASYKWYDKYTSKDNILHFDTSSSAGYHAVVICGYNEDGWLIQNSWGKWWNGDGQCVIPYSTPVREAWSFVDADSEDVVRPKFNWSKWLAKAVNFILNLFKR